MGTKRGDPFVGKPADLDPDIDEPAAEVGRSPEQIPAGERRIPLASELCPEPGFVRKQWTRDSHGSQFEPGGDWRYLRELSAGGNNQARDYSAAWSLDSSECARPVGVIRRAG